MESFNKAWHTAADSLRHDYRSSEQQWTQHGEEPIAGVQGRGTATDPYDAGNRSDQPGAPQTQENTALVPEALSSITPADRSSSLKSNNSKVASGPAALQPELNPIGETAAKYGSQPHRVPEQRNLGSNIDRHSQTSGLAQGYGDRAPGSNQSPSMASAAAAAATASTGSRNKRSEGSLGDATSAQTSAIPASSHPSGLRHTGTLGDATSAQASGLRSDATQPTGLRQPSTTQKPNLKGVETSGLGHTASTTGQTFPIKSALEKDAHETGLRQPASTTHKPAFDKETRTAGLEGSQTLGSTPSYGSQTQIPDRSSQYISSEARHPSSGIAESMPQKSKSTTEQRTSSTPAEGQSSAQDSTSKPSKKDDAVENVGFTPQTDHVSKEALRGPSVSEPREHWKQDEKVAKAEDDDKPAAGQPGGSSSKQESSEKKHAKDSSHSGGTLAHIKEKVEKVIHPHKA
ncbi:hypothetical protein BDV26DRAFT_215474 [Aspergillus bertholletiae]|uniref:Solid-state culture expressed protein (Aos23) n=1 Tax=Aspergillus bertholletiae TaxID=1226010 RepID=A0A5N7B5D1_9EURO|nr:hypothetical protein BDV26DRAFT_215474 [Aspergillus bertholletiae]